MKEKVNPNRREGKYTGYELVNGEYHLAPKYTDQFAELSHKTNAVEDLLAMVTKHATQDLEALSKAKARLWNDIYDDLGLSKEDNLRFYYLGGYIKRDAPKETKPTEATQ